MRGHAEHQGKAGTMRKRVIRFVKFSRFSGTNARVEEQLRRNFPDAELDVIDVRRFFTLQSASFLRTLPTITAQLCVKLLREPPPADTLRDSAVHHLLRMPAIFDGLSRYAIARILRRRAETVFTIQTMSLWNCAVEGIAHFVYTDSAMLTNLYYRAFPFESLPPAAWLARERKLYSDACRIFVMSEHVRRSLLDLYGCDERKVKKVLAGANLKWVPSTPEPAELANKTILFVAMRWKHKGGPELVEAFCRLPERHRDARLLIVGVVPDVNVPNCEIVGLVPADRVPDYYRRAAIFCMPTHIEAFGLVFVEAMLYSVAVAAPRLGAMQDYIEDRVSGVLFEPGNVDDIASTLCYLLDNPRNRQEIGARGFRSVHGNYDWDAVGQRLRAEIEPCLPHE
jgi:glycosyltransferase involved in cell wall biosynthesis